MEGGEAPLESFQFLGIPPKGELVAPVAYASAVLDRFPISRDPPEGGTSSWIGFRTGGPSSFQFLGIPPKGEHLVNKY